MPNDGQEAYLCEDHFVGGFLPVPPPLPSQIQESLVLTEHDDFKP